MAFHSTAAQAPFTVGIGAAIPIGSTADALAPGYNAAASFAFRTRWIGQRLRVEAAVNELASRTRPLVMERVVSTTVNLTIEGAQRAGPTGYVIVGAGHYDVSGRGPRRSDGGMNAGAGIRFPAGVVGTYVEARFHYVAGETRTKYFPMTFGLTF